MGYALWLVPSQSEANDIKDLMRYRPPGSRLPSHSKSYPAVHPHVTLATFDVLPRHLNLRDIVPRKGRVKAHFHELKPGNTYLGALSVRLHLGSDLQRLHQYIVTSLDARRIQWKSRGFPHISSFYVDELSERESLRRGIQSCVGRADDGRLALRSRAERGARSIQRFTGASVWLVNCRSKDVERWEAIERIPLDRPNSARQETDRHDREQAQYCRAAREAYESGQTRPGNSGHHRPIQAPRNGPHPYPRARPRAHHDDEPIPNVYSYSQYCAVPPHFATIPYYAAVPVPGEFFGVAALPGDDVYY